MNRFERDLWRKDGTVAVTQKDDTAQESGSKRKRKKKTKKSRLLGKKEMAGILGEQRDFKLEHTLLEKLHIELCEKDQDDMKHECYETNACRDHALAPKFHVELQEKIERAWAHAKHKCCEECTYSIVSLRKSVPEALDSVPLECFRKWEASMMIWEQAFADGRSIATAAEYVRTSIDSYVLVALLYNKSLTTHLPLLLYP